MAKKRLGVLFPREQGDFIFKIVANECRKRYPGNRTSVQGACFEGAGEFLGRLSERDIVLRDVEIAGEFSALECGMEHNSHEREACAFGISIGIKSVMKLVFPKGIGKRRR